MAETVTMPKLGFDMAEGVLVRWVKKENEKITKGEVLAEIETDKATVEVESPYSGVVAKYLVDQGTSVPVGNPIAVITAEGETYSGETSTPTQPVQEKEKPAPQTEKSVQEMAVSPAETSAIGVIASPLAKRIAREKKLDLSAVRGSGPNGRIVRKDIEAALAKSASTAGTAMFQPASGTQTVFQPGVDERVPLNKLRTAIARRMVEAKQNLPHFYITHQFLADRMMELRQQYNSVAAEDQKLSVNDFIIKAVALALRKFRNLNASISGEALIRHGDINIGVAVSVEGGLLTIVVKHADQKSLQQISAEVKEMASRARQGKVKPDDIEGSTFSISNLGMFDVENFAAIINPPEAAILAVGSVHEAPVIEDGEISIASIFKATVSADHRVTDGVEAAQFMQEVARYIENPVWLVM